MPQINVAQETENLVDQFADSMDSVQRGLYNRVSALLKELSIDSEGMIKQTASNLNIINKVKAELDSVLTNPTFQNNVVEIQSALEDVNDLQKNFYSDTAPDFEQPKVIDAFQEQAFNSAVTDLTGAGMNEYALGHALDIVSNGVKEGQSFATMSDLLKQSMIGDEEIEGRLVSYSKQIASDTLHGQARNYNALVTDKLGFEWFEYIGPLKDTSRPWCIAVEHKRYIHKSELAAISRGDIDGRKVSLAGLMPDTNSENVQSRCGGYNCSHQMVGISSELVPTKIRSKFEDVERDAEDLTDDRPIHE